MAAKSIVEMIADQIDDIGAAAPPSVPMDMDTPQPEDIPPAGLPAGGAAPVPEGGETPIVDGPNAAPPAPQVIGNAGMVSVDLPLFMKLLGSVSGLDIHKLASEAAKLCAQGQTCLGVDDFDSLSQQYTMGGGPGLEAAGIAATADGLGDGLGGEGGPVDGLPGEGGPVDGLPGGDEIAMDDEITDADLPGAEPTSDIEVEKELPFVEADGEGGGDEGGGDEGGGGEPKEEPKKEEPKDDKGDKGGKEPKEEKLEESIKPVTELIECNDRRKGKGKGKKRKSLAEEVSDLISTLSGGKNLNFDGTNKPNAVAFRVKSSQLSAAINEGVAKALAKKNWLMENGFDRLAGYKGVKLAEKDGTRFLILQ